MYTFNRIKVNPQLPSRIEKLSVIANNLWWSWNTDFLKLFKVIDIDLFQWIIWIRWEGERCVGVGGERKEGKRREKCSEKNC